MFLPSKNITSLKLEQVCFLAMITWKKTKDSKTWGPSSSLKHPVAPCGPLWFCGSLAVCGSVVFYGRGFVWGRSKHKVARTQTILADWRQTDKLPIIGECKAEKAGGSIFSAGSVIRANAKVVDGERRRNQSMKIQLRGRAGGKIYRQALGLLLSFRISTLRATCLHWILNTQCPA